MSAAAIAIVGLSGLSMSSVLVVLGVGVLVTLAGYAIWHGRHAAAQKLRQMFAKSSKKSGKEKKNDVPSYAQGASVRHGETIDGAVKRVMSSAGQWPPKNKGPGSAYSKIKKYLTQKMKGF